MQHKNMDYELIKKYYGEKMAQLCRKLFPTLLEIPGLLSSIILSKFEVNRFLYDDIIEQNEISYFRDYIYSLANLNKELIKTDKSVKELLNEAGYDFYECKSDDEIQAFRKYYANGEEICTFFGNRLISCYVFFIVKKDVDKIKREDYIHPERQDKYGTSVVSIQFSRGETNILSIKNRYNDSVENPDATFGNNLDNIIPGLTYAFIKEYNLNIFPDNISTFYLDNYKKVNGKFYKYNYLTESNMYTHDNKVITFNKDKRKNEIVSYDQSRYLIMDCYLVDYEEKKIKLIEENMEDSFVDQFDNITRIVVKNDGDNKILTINMVNKRDVTIVLDKLNRIISLNNPNIKQIGNNFMMYNKVLKNISLDNVVAIGNNFLKNNMGLERIDFPLLERVDNSFIPLNENISIINMPNLASVGDYFLFQNYKLTSVELNKLRKVGSQFMFMNKILNNFIAPRLEFIEDDFLVCNQGLEIIELLYLKHIGNRFMKNNQILKDARLFNVTEVGNEFLFSNINLEKIIMPWLKKVGNKFLYMNEMMYSSKLCSLEEAGDDFLFYNEQLNTSFPKLIKVGRNFLSSNISMKDLSFLKLMEKKDGFLMSHPYKKRIIYNMTMRKKIFLNNLKEQLNRGIVWKNTR